MGKTPETIETNEGIIDGTKVSLSLLEKETRIGFFKKTSNRIKNLFGINRNSPDGGTNLSEQNEGTSSKLKVKETRDYISNGGTFYSPSKGICQRNKYRQVCSTGSFNVLRRLGLPKVSNSTEVDLKGDTLTQMGLKYIGKVDPKNPGKNGYKPQDGDTAVRPKFKLNSGKTTQHQATYINGRWVSDNIQKRMSCYPGQRNEPNCKIYRYMG